MLNDWLLYNKKDTVMDRSQVWKMLEEKNVAKVEIHFQGGNDEGGCDNIVLLDAEGKTIGEMNEWYEHKEWCPETEQWKVTNKPTNDDLLSKALCEPVYEKYYTFAGEFYVDGTLHWCVKDRLVTISASEEVSTWESFEEEV